MKRFLKNNKKWLFMSLFLLVFVTACVNVRNSDGSINKEMLIYLDTGYLDCISGAGGWFNIFVWPVAQLINFVAKFSDAGVGIIVATLLLNLGTAAMSIKQQVSTQKMQLIQPDMQKIQAKYAGKTDQASRMRLAQETQALYKKHDISPFGSIITMFIQLPIIMAVYQAVMRAEAVYTGSFINVDLTQTPMNGFENLIGGKVNAALPVIAIFLLMALAQFFSMKLPQIMQKRRKEKMNIKTKDYANPKGGQNSMANSMNSMMYVSLGMIVIFAINWPLGMSFYWLISSISRIIQNIVIQKYFIKDM